jgi:Mg2+/Co2+ transporter CorB
VHGNIIAALLQRIRAVSQRTLVRIQICSTLSHFLRSLLLTLARMSNRLLRKKRSAEESGESHDELKNEEHATRKLK